MPTDTEAVIVPLRAAVIAAPVTTVPTVPHAVLTAAARVTDSLWSPASAEAAPAIAPPTIAGATYEYYGI